MIASSTNENAAALSVRTTQLLLFVATFLLALLTVAVHVAQIAAIPFRTLSVVSLLLTLVVAIFVIWTARGRLRGVRRQDRGVVLLVALLALAGAALALASHRPSFDDFYYVPNAVYYLQHPDQPLGFVVHFLDAGQQPFTSLFWGTSVAYDYVRAVGAWLLGTDYLVVYHLLSTALVGALIPLAAFYLTSHFADSTFSAALGTLVAVAVLLLLGETHRTFGNFAFNRAFQGKTLLLAAGLPLFAAVTLDFFETRAPFFWLFLLSVTVSMVGATASAIVLLPALALPLLLATADRLCREVEPRRLLLLAGAYAATFAYLGLYAVLLLLASPLELGPDSPVNQGFPPTFFGQLQLVIDPAQPVTAVAVLASTVGALVLASTATRRFLAIWIASLVLLYLNPFVAPLLIEHVASPNLYWRLFYLYPFPLVVSIATAALFRRGAHFVPSLKLRTLCVAIVLLVLLALNWLPSSPSVFQTTTELGWPRYKVIEGELDYARQLVTVAPPGTMLAPLPYSGVIPMLTSDYPQVRIRENGVLLWWSERGMPETAERRLRASRFVGGEIGFYDDFRALLEEDVVDVIVMTSGAYDVAEDQLPAYGFSRTETVGPFVVAWKPQLSYHNQDSKRRGARAADSPSSPVATASSTGSKPGSATS